MTAYRDCDRCQENQKLAQSHEEDATRQAEEAARYKQENEQLKKKISRENVGVRLFLTRSTAVDPSTVHRPECSWGGPCSRGTYPWRPRTRSRPSRPRSTPGGLGACDYLWSKNCYQGAMSALQADDIWDQYVEVDFGPEILIAGSCADRLLEIERVWTRLLVWHHHEVQDLLAKRKTITLQP